MSYPQPPLHHRRQRPENRKSTRNHPEFWLNLQRIYDLDTARKTTNLDDIVPLVESG